MGRPAESRRRLTGVALTGGLRPGSCRWGRHVRRLPPPHVHTVDDQHVEMGSVLHFFPFYLSPRCQVRERNTLLFVDVKPYHPSSVSHSSDDLSHVKCIS